MAKKTANELRAEARKLMEKAKMKENWAFVEAGKLARGFHQGKTELPELKAGLAELFGEAPPKKTEPSKPKKN